MSSISSIQAAMDPSRRWFLPCTSAATAPPMVTWRVPGSTGRIRPCGTIAVSMSVMLVDADARSVAAARFSSMCGRVTGAST